jgi:hypothetical protein
MKKIIVAIFFYLACVSAANCQFSFGVSPGLSLNSAYFGYKLKGKIVPYVGFQYFNANFKYEESGKEYNYSLSDIVDYTNKSDFSGSLYVPNIGVKYFFKDTNKLRAYFNLNISKPFLRGEVTTNGEKNDEFEESLKKIKMLGGELGFGIEYFFDKNFSVGGEFGIRYIHIGYKNSEANEIYNPNTSNYETSTINYYYKYNVSPTFSRITLSYYF